MNLTNPEIVILLREYNTELSILQNQLHVDAVAESKLNSPDYHERARIGKEHKINKNKIITMNIYINTVI